jgi:hypothetical protein
MNYVLIEGKNPSYFYIFFIIRPGFERASTSIEAAFFVLLRNTSLSNILYLLARVVASMILPSRFS